MRLNPLVLLFVISGLVGCAKHTTYVEEVVAAEPTPSCPTVTTQPVVTVVLESCQVHCTTLKLKKHKEHNQCVLACFKVGLK